MFQFRRFPSYAYLIQRRMTEYCSAGFPHSVISGSKPMCGSPKLIAACHDHHRLLMQMHSPCALISLTSPGQAFCCLLLWSTKSGSQESCRLQSYLANCFYPLSEQRLPFRLSSTIKKLCCLLFHSGIIIHIVQFSRCALQPLLRSDFSIQPLSWVLKSALS